MLLVRLVVLTGIQNYIMREGDILYLTKNSKISFSRDIAPILTGAYMVSRIGKD